MSTLQLRRHPLDFAIEVGDEVLNFSITNSEQHNGEVTGWKYKQLNGPRTALLIND